jgi:diguanylate cyclase (GGDEF)-like protein
VKVLHRLIRADHQVMPFLGVAALALAATGLRTAGTDWSLVVVAFAGVAFLGLAGVLLPWSRLPLSAFLVLPIAADGLIVALRQAQGGSISGYGPLAILPVAWVGLTQGRRAVAVISVCTALLFGLPIAIVGDPMYPTSGWRGVVLWAIVAVVVGLGANRVVAEQRMRASLARTHARQLDQLVEVQTVIATSEGGLDSTLKLAAESALSLTNAEGACIELLDGDEVVLRGAAGVCTEFLGLRLKADETITGECFRTGEVLACTDSEEDARVDRDACRRVGARSLIVVPLFYGDLSVPVLVGDVKGVLIVYSSAVDAFRDDEIQILSLLASMIGAALGQSALMERLTSQAVTDELTGLPNRRAWYDQLDRALAGAQRNGQPLGIVILDLDGFKEINDLRGHAAGDALLKTVTDCWTRVMRTTDLLGRIGGDEFGVIVEGTDKAGALEVIARLDLAIADHHHASVGLALWDGKEDATALIARADDDMYEFKRARSASRFT